jgi:hypothetical protein
VVVCTIVLGFVVGAVMAGVGIATGGALAHLTPASEANKAAEREQAAATVGNVIGGMLGTDEKGKQDLGAALSKVAAAGERMPSAGAGGSAGAGSAGAAGSVGGAGGAGSASADSMGAKGSAGTAGSSTAAGGETSAQDAAQAVGGLVAALGGALGGSHRVTPVDFQTLKAMLPAALPGMARTNASGEAKQGLGMQATNATGTYKGADGSTVELSISDASAVSGLMEMAESLPQTTNSESDSGYEKDIMLGGRKVHEKYNTHSHHGELQALVAKRFAIDVTGEGVDMSTLESALGAVDLGKLESMKDANPK